MKLRLTITSGSLAGRDFLLETGFLTVGRSENCSVRFDPLTERIASKQHAFIEARPDGYYITDNHSTNGTLVNGDTVERAKLSNGDTVQFGKNGVTGRVQIDAPEDGQQSDLTVDRFNAYQAAKFEQAAQNQPVSVQSSISQLGLGNIDLSIAPEPPRKSGTKYVLAAIAVFVIIFLSLVASLLISASLSEPGPHGEIRITLEGVGFAILGALVAFTPAVIYILPLVFLDRYDPEPFWLLALAFAWGALIAVIVSIILNTIVGVGVATAIGGEEGKGLGALTSIVISAPIFEEGSKGLGVVMILIFFRKYFDDILDGIVFAGVIALGFATVENVQYYGNAMRSPNLPIAAVVLAFTFLLRGILSPFAHVTFTAMTGIGCGIARESHKKAVRIIMPIVGYLGAVTLHAIWNTLAVVTEIFAGVVGFLIAYVVLEVPFFIIFVVFCGYIMYRQNKILKEMLAMDIARGVIPEAHGRIATSAFRSTGWLIGGLFGGKFFARSRYLRAIGKLGLSYWHIQRATAAQGQTASFQQNPVLREEVLRWRDKV
jgi:RsiW-degrading membrane proteinase PrsW (M82 family)